MLAARCIREMVVGNDMREMAIRDAMDFYARQFVGALSATNFAVSNPEVIRATIDTGGENLINGLKNLLQEGIGRERQLEPKPPRKPDLLSATNRDDARQGHLPQRTHGVDSIPPTCDRVLKRPLLFVPAWLNKYYVLDLRTTNSLVRWAIDQGHTVFMISWVDPQGQVARMSFADYVLQGPVRSLDVFSRRAARSGLMPWATASVVRCSLPRSRISPRSETTGLRPALLTAMLDFSQPGELGALMDEATLCQLDDDALEQDGADVSGLAKTWNMQRENDLLWSFVVNNYLLGRDPLPFDLYWNWDFPGVRSASIITICRIFTGAIALSSRMVLQSAGGVSIYAR